MNGHKLTIALVMAAPFPALQGSQVLVCQLAEGLARRESENRRSSVASMELLK